MIVSKQNFIDSIVQLLEDEDISILQVTRNNDSESVYKNGWAENVLTGYTNIKIELLDKKLHEEFVKKFQA